jgi:hypothetical protein
LSASGTNVFGTGEVTILPEGRLNIIDSVAGNLVLAGGVLGMSPSNFLASPTLRGDLSVTKDSYLFISPLFDGRRLSPIIESTLSLFDQTNLNISPDIATQPDQVAGNVYFEHVQEQITVTGDIVVNGAASMTSFDASVRLEGAIRPAAEHATLNLIGNDTFDFRGSIQLEESKSLAVTIDGEIAPLSVIGAGNSLAGDGTYIGEVVVGHSASIAPGNSPGELTIVGDTTIDEGAIYEWELASVNGTPGEAWDLLQVEGDLYITATDEAPWTLRISDLPGFEPRPAHPWLIASANSITGFDSAAVRFDVAGISDVWPSLTSNNLFLYTQNGDLFLQVIPEPATWILAVVGIAVAAMQQCQRGR